MEQRLSLSVAATRRELKYLSLSGQYYQPMVSGAIMIYVSAQLK